jgi:hypothetical protein
VADEAVAAETIWTLAIPASRKLDAVRDLGASMKTHIVALVDVNAVDSV